MTYGTYGNTETKDNVYQSKRTRSFSTSCVQLVTHQISFTKSQCSKQVLNLMCGVNHPKFPSRICAKMSMTKINLLRVISVNFGFILNVTNSIIQIIGNYKTVMNSGNAQNVAALFFFSTPYQATQSSWFVVQTLIATSHSEKIQKMIVIALSLLVNQNLFNLLQLPPDGRGYENYLKTILIVFSYILLLLLAYLKTTNPPIFLNRFICAH